MKTFNKLPNEIIELIIDFCSPEEYNALRKVNREFKGYFQKNQQFWAKELFHTRIQYPSKLIIQFKLEEIPKYFCPSNLEFSQYESPMELTYKLSDSLNKLSDTLITLKMAPKEIKSMLNRFNKVFIDPTPPEPILKKDIHMYPTGSEFQTYLTEIYHGIVYKPRRDAERDNLKKIFEGMKDFTEKSDLLQSMRWYQYENIKSWENSQYSQIAEFYFRFVEFIKINCLIYKTHIESLTDTKRFMREYKRIWNEFSYGIRDFDIALTYFANCLNNAYATAFPDQYQKPGFSIWRLMVKIWHNEVYLKLEERLKESYLEVFKYMLVNEVLFSNIHPDKQLELKKEFEDLLHLDEFIPVLDDFKKTSKCLRTTLSAVDDMSLNEFTVFYNDCSEPTEGTPKFRFVDHIITELESFNIKLVTKVENITELRSIVNRIEDYLSKSMNKSSATKVFAAIISQQLKNKDQAKDASGLENLAEQLKVRQVYTKKDLSQESDYIESRGHRRVNQELQKFYNWFNNNSPVSNNTEISSC